MTFSSLRASQATRLVRHAVQFYVLDLRFYTDVICAIIAGVGFKKELGGGVQMFPELAVVQVRFRCTAPTVFL